MSPGSAESSMGAPEGGEFEICLVSAASPRSPLPSLIAFPWNPAFPDAGLDALAGYRDIAMEVVSRNRFATLRLSYKIRFSFQIFSFSKCRT